VLDYGGMPLTAMCVVNAVSGHLPQPDTKRSPRKKRKVRA
jgi:hypothetical protein